MRPDPAHGERQAGVSPCSDDGVGAELAAAV